MSDREPTRGEMASVPLGNDVNFPSCGYASGIIQVTQRRPGLLYTIEGFSFKMDQPDT